MNFYFDTEFTGLHNGTGLISIGIIDENNRTFYAEFTDYDKSQITPWITENVISHLKFKNATNEMALNNYNEMTVCGSKAYVSDILHHWFNKYGDDQINFVTDVGHYDMILLIDLLSNDGEALHLDKKYPATYDDLNSVIAEFYSISPNEAFNYTREILVKTLKETYGTQDIPYKFRGMPKHNSLFDACVIKTIYEAIATINKDTFAYIKKVVENSSAEEKAKLAQWVTANCPTLSNK